MIYDDPRFQFHEIVAEHKDGSLWIIGGSSWLKREWVIDTYKLIRKVDGAEGWNASYQRRFFKSDGDMAAAFPGFVKSIYEAEAM